MEHKILRMKNEQQAEAKETRVEKGQGVIFIKSRMSDDKIHALVAEMLEVADETDVEVVDIIVDEFAGGDIDRESVDRLSDWIENSGVSIIFVKSITDISNFN